MNRPIKNKKKSLFVILGSTLLIAGYLIRRHKLFIPYRQTDQAERANLVSESKEKSFFFKDQTSEVGLSFFYRPPKISPIAYFRVDSLVQGPGSASIDINKDGYMDLFIVSPRPENPSHLYISNKGKDYTEKAKEYGLSKISSKKFFGLVPIFFDSDNDGDLDLYVSGIGCARFYENIDNHFYDRSKKSNLDDCKSSQAAIFFDYNDDKLLDLYILRYWGKSDLINKNDPYIYVNNLHNADNGGVNTLYRNMGNNTFKDVTSIDGGADAHWSYDASYADLNNDGRFEVYISNDYGPDVIYQVADQKLIDISDTFEVPDRRYGMNVSLLDLGQEEPGVYISNQYIGHGYGLYGNFFWQMRDRKNIADKAKDFNLYNCGMAWGAAHGDFNLDGREDLYVGNGFAAPRDHYLKDHDVDFYKSFYNLPSITQNSSFYYEWFLTALPGRVTRDIRNWKKLSHFGSRYDQKDCLFLNYKNEYFFNLSNELSDIKIWNAKSVVTTDRKNNGVLDLLVTTNNGPVHFLENQLLYSKTAKNWIGFKLSSNKTNKQAIGAKLIIKQGDKKYYRWNTGGRSGLLSTSDPRLHFGLENSKSVDLQVRWQNGELVNYGEFRPGKYYEIHQ